MARQLGADWQALAWQGPKPSTGLPAAARQARHQLLAGAARSLGAGVILLGHTADDLAESAWMRREGTPSLPVPREWSPSPVWPEGRCLFLFRPLLDVRRQDLRQRLGALGLTWIDDPANQDLRFARARARHALRVAPGFRGTAVPVPWADAGRTQLATRVICCPEGYAMFDRSLAREGPVAALNAVLGAAVVSIGGALAPPARAPLERLIAALAGTAPLRAHLAGVRLAADATRVVLARDARDLRRRAGPDVEGVFDNRFETAPGSSVGFLAGRAARLSPADKLRLKAVPAIARPSLPVLAPDSATPHLPAPIGTRDPPVTALAPARFAAACGLIACEAEIG
jgi:tRNA(Ile)-lysidine synthase